MELAHSDKFPHSVMFFLNLILMDGQILLHSLLQQTRLFTARKIAKLILCLLQEQQKAKNKNLRKLSIKDLLSYQANSWMRIPILLEASIKLLSCLRIMDQNGAL